MTYLYERKRFIFMIIVDQKGSGDFTSLQAALVSIERDTSPIKIFIKAGIYKERIEIIRPNVALFGESRENTIITYDNYAKMKLEDGSLLRTFRTYSVFLDGKNFSAENITFVNSSGLGKDVGQAIAVYAKEIFLPLEIAPFLEARTLCLQDLCPQR